jgi:hypothetical protein
MIIRTVLVKLIDEWATDAGRAAVADHSQKALSAIPGVVEAHALVPADEKALASWDVMFDVRFAAIEDVQPYAVHPLHVSFLDDYLNPKAAVKKAWNWSR